MFNVFAQQPTTYFCPKCQAYYKRSGKNVACAVMHLPGDCCHYGEHRLTEADITTWAKSKAQEATTR